MLCDFKVITEKCYSMIKVTNKGTSVEYLCLKPISEQCRAFHTKDGNRKNRDANAVQVSLANIQGLITTKRNKCSFLEELLCKKGRQHIVALTETWTRDKYKWEILEYFKDYNLLMTDRVYDASIEDPYQLKT